MRKLILNLLFTTSCFTVAQADPLTQVANSSTAVVAYSAGDIADCRSKQSTARSVATAGLINADLKRNPTAIVLTLGDHTYPVGLPAEFARCYQPSWGQFKDRTYPSPGNHEYYSPNGYGYFQYFGDAAGSQQHSFYSVEKAAWHIISLNSSLQGEAQQAQLAWLKSDLQHQHSACILAYWHHPLYSSGLHGNNANMQAAWELLMAAKADVVLSGHDHHYERFGLQDSDAQENSQAGIREFIVGTGGAKFGPVFFRKAHSEAINTKENGVLKLTLNQGSYEWQFLTVADGVFTDQGKTDCHAK